ncbi:MAG: hypothetical protein QXP70_02945 [Methanomassiliicoccales archaeon]
MSVKPESILESLRELRRWQQTEMDLEGRLKQVMDEEAIIRERIKAIERLLAEDEGVRLEGVFNE